MLANNEQPPSVRRQQQKFYMYMAFQLGQQPRNGIRMEPRWAEKKSVLNKWLKLNELGRLKRIHSVRNTE